MTHRPVSIGTAHAEPGTMAKGAVHIAKRPDGSSVFIPVIVVNGIEEGPVLGMDGCTHGTEYEGAEAVQAVVAQLDPRKMRGTFVGVPVVNTPAFQAMQRGTPNEPLANPDVNRVYPGKPDGSLTERIAHAHFSQVVSCTQVMISVHAGGTSMIPPKVIYHETDDELGRKNLEIAKAFGWEILWQDGSYPGTLHGAARTKGIVCIAPEFGGTDRMPPLRRERTRRFVVGTTNVMKHLGMLEGSPELPQQYEVVKGESHIRANNGGILNYDPSFELGKPVTQGQKIATIVDLYGDWVETVVAPLGGIAIMMRGVPLVNAGDWVVGIGQRVRTIV